jgi:hypothetical protein
MRFSLSFSLTDGGADAKDENKETHGSAGLGPAVARTAPGSCRCTGALGSATATRASTAASFWPSPSASAAPAAASTTTKPYART